jgi:hypothetical protein
MMETVELSDVQGQLRNIIWAMQCCHGYDPCDHVFWGIASGKPMGDKAWTIICSMIKKSNYDVPQTLIDSAKEQDNEK